jgi:hypothetical protein
MARENKMVLIEAEDATIATVSVTIQAIQVSKRQMTQSVFRQLPAANLIDETNVRLLGIPWGWVNYRWGDIPESHTNFIFQAGTRLFRNAFRIRTSSTFPNSDSREQPHRYRSLLGEALKRRRLRAYVRLLGGAALDDPEWKGGCIEYDLSDEIGHQGNLGLGDEARAFLNSSRNYREHVSDMKQDEGKAERWAGKHRDDRARLERLRVALEKSRVALDGEVRRGFGLTPGEPIPCLDEIDRSADHVHSAIRDYCCRWDLLMDQLHGVEQLFIAC